MAHAVEKKIVPDLSRMYLRYQLRVWSREDGPFYFIQGLIRDITITIDPDGRFEIIFSFQKTWSNKNDQKIWKEEPAIQDFSVSVSTSSDFLKLLKLETYTIDNPFEGWIQLISDSDVRVIPE